MRALALLLLPVAAQAQTLAETHFTMNFCYEARLDAVDWAGRPESGLRSVALAREPSGYLQKLGETPVQVRTTFFGDDREYHAMADCAPEQDGLDCQLANEGGSFRLEAEGEDVRMMVSGDGMAFRSTWSDGQRLGPSGGAAALVLRRCG